MPAASASWLQHDRVAVGRGVGGLGGADHAAGAADVFDHDRLAERLLHGVLDDARGGVVGAAGRERHDHGHGTIGIGLRRSGAGCQNSRGEKRRRERACENHDSPQAVRYFRSAAADRIADRLGYSPFSQASGKTDYG